MEQCSEASAYTILTPGNYPEENIQQNMDVHHSESVNWHTTIPITRFGCKPTDTSVHSVRRMSIWRSC
jgi:hypothetical protein